jgi:hypothetical protein
VKVAGEVGLGAFCHEGEDGGGSVGSFVEPLGHAAERRGKRWGNHWRRWARRRRRQLARP